MGIPEKIKAIQDEMAKTQINKATEHHVGLLKAKIAKLKREQEFTAKKEGIKISSSGSNKVEETRTVSNDLRIFTFSKNQVFSEETSLISLVLIESACPNTKQETIVNNMKVSFFITFKKEI